MESTKAKEAHRLTTYQPLLVRLGKIGLPVWLIATAATVVACSTEPASKHAAQQPGATPKYPAKPGSSASPSSSTSETTSATSVLISTSLCNLVPKNAVEQALGNSNYNFNNQVPCTADISNDPLAHTYLLTPPIFVATAVWGPISGNEEVVAGIAKKVQQGFDYFASAENEPSSVSASNVPGHKALYNDVGGGEMVSVGDYVVKVIVSGRGPDVDEMLDAPIADAIVQNAFSG